MMMLKKTESKLKLLLTLQAVNFTDTHISNIVVTLDECDVRNARCMHAVQNKMLIRYIYQRIDFCQKGPISISWKKNSAAIPHEMWKHVSIHFNILISI